LKRSEATLSHNMWGGRPLYALFCNGRPPVFRSRGKPSTKRGQKAGESRTQQQCVTNAKERLSDEEQSAIRSKLRARDEYELVETETRNLLICGPPLSGKTTTVRILKDPCFTPQSEKMFLERKHPNFQSFTINNRSDATAPPQMFTINIIETPGLFETRGDSERSNEVLAQTIKMCLQNDVDGIHCIILFLTFEAGSSRDLTSSMELFLDLFSGADIPVALCVTHADQHSDSWRLSVTQQFMQHPKLSILIEAKKISILFMGCVDTIGKHYTDPQQLEEDYVSVYNMRKEFLEFIFVANQKVLLSQMNVARKKIQQAAEALAIITNNFRTCAQMTYSSSFKMQKLIQNHQDNMDYLRECAPFLSVPELSSRVTALMQEAQAFSSRQGNKELKELLISPLNL